MADYRVKGALFENLKDSGPALTGFIDIDPSQFAAGPDGRIKINLALWPKTSAKGQNYMQASEDKQKNKPASAPSTPMKSPFSPRKPVVSKANDDLDDGSDIPF